MGWLGTGRGELEMDENMREMSFSSVARSRYVGSQLLQVPAGEPRES